MGDKVGYAVIKEEHTIKKRILIPQNTVFSLELLKQSNLRKNRHKIVVITDF
jgi:hypothetical protein